MRNPKLEKISKTEDDNPDNIMKLIEKEMTSVKFKAFGKVKVKKKENKELEKLIVKKKTIIEDNPSENTSVHEDIKKLDKQICKALSIVQMKRRKMSWSH